MNKIKIPDWVPFGLGGKGFNIELIPRLKSGMDFVPSDYFPAYLDYGERVLTQQENQIYTALGGLEGMVRNIGPYSIDGGSGREINYAKMGKAIVDAFVQAGIKLELKGRELGRVTKGDKK